MDKTFGQEIMRVDFSRDDEVRKLKEKYAELYDEGVELMGSMESKVNESIKIAGVNAHTDPEVMKTHMTIMNKAQETMRCIAESSKLLEMACMFHVKALTA